MELHHDSILGSSADCKFDLGQVIHLSVSPVIHKAEITMHDEYPSYYPPGSKYSVNAIDVNT